MNKKCSSRWWKQNNLGTKCIGKWKSLMLIRNTLLCLMHKIYHKKTILEKKMLNLSTRACGWCKARYFQKLIYWTTKRSISYIILKLFIVVITFWTRLITCWLLWGSQRSTTHVLKTLWSSFNDLLIKTKTSWATGLWRFIVGWMHMSLGLNEF